MHFFDKNGNLTPCPAQPSADVKELFFREVILHQFLKQKNIALYSKNIELLYMEAQLSETTIPRQH